MVTLFFQTFEELIIRGDLVVEETFNNLNIPEDIAVLNRTQTLKGKHERAINPIVSNNFFFLCRCSVCSRRYR